MRMTVFDLKAALQGVPDTALVTFQGNVEGEDDEGGEPGYTTCTGYLYSAFEPYPGQLVLDCAITDSEF